MENNDQDLVETAVSWLAERILDNNKLTDMEHEFDTVSAKSNHTSYIDEQIVTDEKLKKFKDVLSALIQQKEEMLITSGNNDQLPQDLLGVMEQADLRGCGFTINTNMWINRVKGYVIVQEENLFGEFMPEIIYPKGLNPSTPHI